MERVEKRELPGNDASWYQAMLEERDRIAAPAPPDTAASPTSTSEPDTVPDATLAPLSLERLPPEPPDLEVSPVEPVVPTITAVPPLETDDSPPGDTSEMVGKIWTPDDSDGPLTDWEPGAIDKKISSSRSFRWTSILGIIAVIALIAAGLVVLPSITRNRADAHLEMMTSALRDLRAELPDTQTSLALATDPTTEAVALGDLGTQLTTLADRGAAVDEAAQADLPTAPPLTSTAAIDELEPIRQRLEPLGTVANTIQRRISDLVAYRTLMSGFLDLPELPVSADSAAQAELRVALAAAQADSAAILGELPGDVSLAEHQALARDLNERFATWQVDYLEALRVDDAVAAGDLISELRAALSELDRALVNPLAQIRRQTDTDIIDLAQSIDQVVALANGSSAAP